MYRMHRWWMVCELMVEVLASIAGTLRYQMLDRVLVLGGSGTAGGFSSAYFRMRACRVFFILPMSAIATKLLSCWVAHYHLRAVGSRFLYPAFVKAFCAPLRAPMLRTDLPSQKGSMSCSWSSQFKMSTRARYSRKVASPWIRRRDRGQQRYIPHARYIPGPCEPA